MPRIRRRFLLEPAEVGIYHCINRCVRRSFLFGTDPISGKNYDHRRQWIQDRMEFLAGQFGVDVLGFAVMSNHLHVVLRNRPDVVQNWPDAEVARRWWNLFPKRRDREGNPQEPTDSELQMAAGDQAQLAELRQRLSSVSWFMRCLVEPAPAANVVRADWLSPFELSEATASAAVPSARASNKGCLPMSFAEYLDLLDWTGRQLRENKRGAIPQNLAPILDRLQISGAGWMQLMGQFSRLFRRAAGRPQSLQHEREQRGCRLMQGIRHSRTIFF